MLDAWIPPADDGFCAGIACVGAICPICARFARSCPSPMPTWLPLTPLVLGAAADELSIINNVFYMAAHVQETQRAAFAASPLFVSRADAAPATRVQRAAPSPGTYFVSNALGLDNNDGLTEHSAISLAKLQLMLRSGQVSSVRFRAGEVFYVGNSWPLVDGGGSVQPVLDLSKTSSVVLEAFDFANSAGGGNAVFRFASQPQASIIWLTEANLVLRNLTFESAFFAPDVSAVRIANRGTCIKVTLSGVKVAGPFGYGFHAAATFTSPCFISQLSITASTFAGALLVLVMSRVVSIAHQSSLHTDRKMCILGGARRIMASPIGVSQFSSAPSLEPVAVFVLL
jgi:hypothetical protein